MISRKEIFNFLGRAIFVVIFFFLVSVFSDKDARLIQYNSMSILNSSSMNAVAADLIELPLFGKNWVSLIDKSSFVFFNENVKIFATNNKIDQRIILFQKARRLIKTTTICGFYCHLFPIDSDALPNLS